MLCAPPATCWWSGRGDHVGIGAVRVGQPEDIASSVRWLVSPDAGFVSGTVVEVDGGRTIKV
jgi:NAD(P)-dependent dehydrogenase (short-subunit alcohol dehydrogenase family)